ncbi:hypothetical protein K437DRAFT_211866, partial [Tilletiaria anomala UBC 951]
MATVDADCSHPVQVAGLCAVCGRELDSAVLLGVSIAISHASAGIKVSASEAKRLDAESTAQLLRQRRLALIIDLDQTIIHATVDPTVGEWLKDPQNPNYAALSNVGRFKLGMDGKTVLGFETHDQVGDRAASEAPDEAVAGCWYYVKPRPGLADFLRGLARKYELHVYTMGTRSYADCVCRLVDPDGTLFGSRILSRDENGSLLQKSLSRLFPVDTSMVVIIDDRADVWSRSPNLIKVNPYDFFVGIGDINATFLPAAPPPPLPSPTLLTDGETDITAEASPDMSSTIPEEAGAPTPPADAPESPALAAASSTPLMMGLEGADAITMETSEAGAAAAAAEEKAEKDQRAVLTEQIDSRPLAKMQEALEEKLSHCHPSSSDSAGPCAKVSEAPHQDNAPGADADEAAPSSLVEPGPLQRLHAVLKDDDAELARVQEILDAIHERWYAQWDGMHGASMPLTESPDDLNALAARPKPAVMNIIGDIKRLVLAGCNIVFSGVIPLGEKPQERVRVHSTDIWRVAEEFGARCSLGVNATVTHLIAAKAGTEKVRQATRIATIHVLHPSWFHTSVAHWAREEEEWYILPKDASSDSPSAALFLGFGDDSSDCESDADQQRDPAGEQADALPAEVSLSGIDWGEAADEVDAYLDDS